MGHVTGISARSSERFDVLLYPGRGGAPRSDFFREDDFHDLSRHLRSALFLSAARRSRNIQHSPLRPSKPPSTPTPSDLPDSFRQRILILPGGRKHSNISDIYRQTKDLTTGKV